MHGEDEEDFDVGFEPGALEDDAPGTQDAPLEDVETEQALAEGMPPDLEEEGEGEDDNDEADAGDEDTAADDAAADANARLQAAEERALTAEVQSIQQEGRAAIAFVEQQMNASKVALDALDDKISNATALLAKAKDEGDTTAEIAIERKLREMYELKDGIGKARAEMPTKDQIIAHTNEQVNAHVSKVRSTRPSTSKDVGVGIRANVPLAEKWASSNSWMKTNKAANDFVVKASEELVKEKWDMNTPGFYAELTRRTARAFPNLQVKALQAAKRAAGKASVKTPVAPGRSSSGGAVRKAPPNKLSKYKLSTADVAAMRRHNLNPLDPLARREFARSRIESARRNA
jgi:hypothetical protein